MCQLIICWKHEQNNCKIKKIKKKLSESERAAFKVEQPTFQTAGACKLPIMQ